jgi:hypothetical protein
MSEDSPLAAPLSSGTAFSLAPYILPISIAARGWATTRLKRKISRPHVSTPRPLETRLMIFVSNELLERRAIMGR